jgi:hypothetical protein
VVLLQRHREQALGGLCVEAALHDDVEHHPVLIHAAPEPVLHADELDHDVVQVPFVARTRQPTSDQIVHYSANFGAHYRTVSCLTMISRAAGSSSTMRSLSGKRK